MILLLLLGYGLLDNLVIQEEIAVSYRLYDLLSLGMLYLLLRWVNNKTIRLLLIVPVLVGLMQVIYGELQLYGVYSSLHSGFPVTGSFFNPGPYAGYLAAVFPAALGLYLIDKWPAIMRSWMVTSIKSISLITVLGILLVLPVAGSRAAWLAVILSGVFLCYHKYHGNEKLSLLFPTRLKKVIGTSIGTALLALALYGVYVLKKDSADGRLLIWKASWGLIEESPLFGIGFDRFRAGYMEAQADYFRANPDDYAIPLADNVVYAFNEGIQLLAEQGGIGLGLVLTVIWLAFSIRGSKERPEIWIAQAGLLSLLIFGMFSYPSHILPIKLCGVLYLAILAGYTKRVFKLPVLAKPIRLGIAVMIGLFSIAILWQVYLVYQGTKDWKDALSYYERNSYGISLNKYEKAYPVFSREGDFLCNYGKALSVAGEHTKAVIILEEAKNYLNNTIIQTALGDSYQALGMYSEAEEAYRLGADMLPDRFYPKYLLAKLYHTMGDEAKTRSLANYLVEKEPKVPSQAVREIKEEMKGLLEELGN